MISNTAGHCARDLLEKKGMVMTQPDMRGKVCVVTGSGLGKATALGLAKRGATVILACRDQQRGQATFKK